MPDQNNLPIKNMQSEKITSFSINKNELKELCDKLQERSDASALIELENYSPKEITPENLEEDKEKIKKAFKLSVTIKSIDNKELYGTINEVFNSPNFPRNIKSVYVNSETKLKALYNYHPRNAFELFLDFSKPGIFDFSILPSSKTPNESFFKVTGYDPTWVNGVFSEITSVFKDKNVFLSKVHSHSVYDVLLMALGLPLSFWACFKVSPLLASLVNNFLINAIYVYVFLIAAWIFRIFFHYLRWICPLVEYEYEGNKTLKHKIVLGAVTFGIISSFVYDVIKYMIT